MRPIAGLTVRDLALGVRLTQANQRHRCAWSDR